MVMESNALSKELENLPLDALMRGVMGVVIDRLNTVPEARKELMNRMANDVLQALDKAWPGDQKLSSFDISWMFISVMTEVLTQLRPEPSVTELPLLRLCVQSALMVFMDFDANKLLSKSE